MEEPVGTTAQQGDRGSAPRPTLELGRVRLRPVTPADYTWLFALETDPAVIYRWRLQGITPSPEQFQRHLWQTTLCQFIVEERVNKWPVGLVMAYAADHVNQLAHIGFVSDPRFAQTGLATDGMRLFIDYLFMLWSFRKLYGESVSYNFEQFSPENPRLDVEGLFRVEGVLRDHTYFAGQYWDKFIVSISRDDWTKHREVVFNDVEYKASYRATTR